MSRIAHRRLIMESSRENPIGTADDIQSHRVQAAEIAEHAADVAKAAKAVKGKATFIAAALGSVYRDEIQAGDVAREKKKPQQDMLDFSPRRDHGTAMSTMPRRLDPSKLSLPAPSRLVKP